ncbi:MAG TPA: hypothetical protein VL547_21595, partial [Dinghuibacter sp.]|uniref:hypothetical protein n=1 Tax=Dinghuibacter sp. TaxID=2024697 RepID=UPI002C5E4AFC
LHGLNFWVREKKSSTSELDYLYAFDGKLIPIEVKSGKEGALRSLHNYMDIAPHSLAIRLYAGERHITTIKTDSGKVYYLLSLPYYLVSQLDAYLSWFEKEVTSK